MSFLTYLHCLIGFISGLTVKFHKNHHKSLYERLFSQPHLFLLFNGNNTIIIRFG